MKIENTHYAIMKVGNIEIGNETVYVHDNSESGFTNDIREATKCVNRKTALSLKYDLEFTKNNGYESDMQIVPVKITYEW